MAVEIVSEVSLRDDHKEKRISEIGECSNKYNDHAGQHALIVIIQFYLNEYRISTYLHILCNTHE